MLSVTDRPIHRHQSEYVTKPNFLIFDKIKKFYILSVYDMRKQTSSTKLKRYLDETYLKESTKDICNFSINLTVNMKWQKRERKR